MAGEAPLGRGLRGAAHAALVGTLAVAAALTGFTMAGTGSAAANTLSPAWSQVCASSCTAPSARYGAATAFDPASGRLLLFGGYNGASLGDTWSWDGSSWTQLCTGSCTAPSARYGAAMAFDPATGRLVLFGGYGNGAFLGDTWSWDGSSWTEMCGSCSPGGRYAAAMAFDPASGRLVLFGGFNSGVYLGDTWSWDGSSWTQVCTVSCSPPGAREGAAMAFVPATGRLVLFGGYGNGGYLGDTWSWDGSSWTQVCTGSCTAPGPRYAPAMAFDPATGRPVLFGGYNGASLGDTWTWDGSSWSQACTGPCNAPGARELAAMTFDPATGQLVLFGGYNGASLGDTWTWAFPGGAVPAWSQTCTSSCTAPSARYGASMAFDPATGQLLVFGGSTNDGYVNETWTWDGTKWTQVCTSSCTAPPARKGASMAFDPATGQLVLFGGYSGAYLGDTWTWNGTEWTQVCTNSCSAPSARYVASMAFDPASGQLLLFGGYSHASLGDTWSWDGTQWTQVCTSSCTAPAARDSASMAFDPATGQLLLFGGSNDTGYLKETWTWNGTQWTQVCTSSCTAPSARSYAGMAFDAATGQQLLFGGSNDTGYLNDTWTWDGTEWTQVCTNSCTAPGARQYASMSFDPATGQLVLFGGYNGSILGDTWIWAPSGTPPAFTSPASGALLILRPGSITVTTSGSPAPSISESGTLPKGVVFKDNKDGTAGFSGTPAGGTAGYYPVTLTAHNGIGSDAVQHFTLQVGYSPGLSLHLNYRSPARLGQPILATTSMTAPPRGSMSFYVAFDKGAATPIAGCQNLKLSSSNSSCQYTPSNPPGAGTYTITASYSGTRTYVPASASQSVTVS